MDAAWPTRKLFQTQSVSQLRPQRWSVSVPLIDSRLCDDCSPWAEMCPADAFAEPFDFNVAGQQMTMAKIDIEACRSYCGPDAYGAQCGRECMTTCPVGTVQK